MDPIRRVSTRLVAMEAPPVKRCANRACETPNLPVKGRFCSATACKRRRAELSAAKKLGGGGSSEAHVAEDDGTQCFEVYAVYGVSRCDVSKMTPVQRRNELTEADESWSYELFGKFGTSEEDNGYDDTRKVLLAELLKNVDSDSLRVLQAFDKNIKKKVGAVKSAMLEEEEEADAERAASPPAPESAA